MTLQWERIVASRSEGLAPLPFEELEGITDIDGLIFFAGGAPPIDLLPVSRLRQAIAHAWEDPGEAMGYDETPGHMPLRSLIAERMATRGTRVHPDQILITNGSQQGLDFIARVLFDPGDVVVVEGPSYFGAFQAFNAYQVSYRVAPIDDQGLIPEALEELLQEEPRPKAIYTIPTFQNPTGVSTSLERRQAIVDLSHRYGVPIIEDDPYGELHFPGNEAQPLRALDDDVVYLGTFSKTLAPSLRMGWMVMPRELVTPLVSCKEAVDIQADRILQRAIVCAVADGWIDQHLDRAREIYASRCQAMLDALQRHMPSGTRWITPEGGFFIWVTLPGEITGNALLPVAGRHGVGYYPGSAFYPDRRQVPALRLGFSTLPVDAIDEGIARLGRATSEMIDRA